MAQIQMTEALAASLIQRFQTEHGTTVVANFALDILLDGANARIAELLAGIKAKDEQIAALSERAKLAEATVEQFKQDADPKRAEVMGAADKVKRMQVEKRATNSHTE